MWLATDNGVSRFDGKRFINYTTKNGLPSNDVIQIYAQKDGTIWANCYKQPPSYYNEKLNQFICLNLDQHINYVSSELLTLVAIADDSDLYFSNYLGSFVYSKKRVINKLKYKDS